ncbi:MAG TPA: threonine synthase [Caldithrix sp.]|nr:threonine synthase [Caldithrix sp.]
MSSYTYRCFQCKTQFSSDEIEQNHHYLCPNCGEANSRMPLKGLLLIEYPYDKLGQIYTREQFLKFPPGQFWRYPYLLPLDRKEVEQNSPFRGISWDELFSGILPSHKLRLQKMGQHEVWIFDDTNNPTFSYKDRASILVALKAKQMGVSAISAASTGNAGSSMAGICARLGLEAHIWVPESIPEGKLMQMLAYGAQVYLVKGDYDHAFDLCLEISRKMNWYNRNTAYNPLTLEGKKSGAFDIFLSMKGSLPKYIFVPVGDGVILGGIFKGFQELRYLGFIKSLPRLVAVQSSGSDALVRYLATGRFEYQPVDTLADSISAGAPRNLYYAAHAVRESGGFAIAVEDSEMVEAQKMIGEKMGILAEPAAAASLAGYLKVQDKLELTRGQKPLLLLTGSGLKDVDSLKRLHRRPIALEEELWRERFE